MKLSAFRIENYRCIQDSGWVELGDIAVVVGKNESGKTSLLKALWKFKPFHDAKYDLDREWPRGRRKDKSLEKVVSTVRFEFSPEEIALIEGIHESAKGITGAEIKRNYRGSYLYNFLPKNPSNDHDIAWVVSLLEEKLGQLSEQCSDHFKSQYRAILKSFADDVRDNGGSKRAIAKLPEFKNRYPGFVQHGHDSQAVQTLNQAIDSVLADLKATPIRQAIDAIHERLPTFIYMDDYKIFRGSAQLNQIKQRKDNENLTADDETLIQIMEMAGLDLDEEVKKGNAQDKEQRMLDLNDASLTLTDEIAARWSQKKYEVRFEADGQHFITFVKDVGVPALVPLEERSKGFQWFFSFDMMFMYETQGKFENAIVLLDEPGLHLHAAAQRDLLVRMREYAKKNQLIYTTHLPFMIDFTRLDNIYVCEEKETDGTKVHKDWATADKDARFTLQAALGLSWSQSLFVGQFNLIVEGVTDYWFLTTISTMLKDAGDVGIDDQLVITPAGGASRVAYVGTILHGQQLNVAVLLDSDKEGDEAFKQLVHQWILKDRFVLRIGEILGVTANRTLEDLFDEAYYLALTQIAYAKELGGKKLALAARPNVSLVERIAEALKQAGIPEFNKGRVAKRIMDDLAKRKLADLPQDTVGKFKKVIVAINGIVAGWKSGGQP